MIASLKVVDTAFRQSAHSNLLENDFGSGNQSIKRRNYGKLIWLMGFDWDVDLSGVGMKISIRLYVDKRYLAYRAEPPFAAISGTASS